MMSPLMSDRGYFSFRGIGGGWRDLVFWSHWATSGRALLALSFFGSSSAEAIGEMSGGEGLLRPIRENHVAVKGQRSRTMASRKELGSKLNMICHVHCGTSDRDECLTVLNPPE